MSQFPSLLAPKKQEASKLKQNQTQITECIELPVYWVPRKLKFYLQPIRGEGGRKKLSTPPSHSRNGL